MSQYLKGTQVCNCKIKSFQPILGTHFSSLKSFYKSFFCICSIISCIHANISIHLYVHTCICMHSCIDLDKCVWCGYTYTCAHTGMYICIHFTFCILTYILKVSDSQSSHLMARFWQLLSMPVIYTNQNGFSNLTPISKTPWSMIN